MNNGLLKEIIRNKSAKKNHELETKYANLKKEYYKVLDELEEHKDKINKIQIALKRRGILINLRDILGED